MSKANARQQLANVWLAAAEDLMGMTESELDAELKELGVDPATVAQKGKAALEQATAQARSLQRAKKREQMEAARRANNVTRDPAVTVEMAKQYLARLVAANDAKLTLAARNRDPKDLSDEEALALYWQLQDLSR
jgi:hypothetical protein